VSNDTPQRLNVVFRILWQGDWHAGSGEGSAGIDRLVRRLPPDANKQRLPFLPGSQLKGVLRHQCERLAALLGCDVVPPHQVGSDAPRELLRHFGPLARSGLLVDRLFGTRYQGECLFVEDALPESGDPWPARAHGRTSIDRLSRTARDRTLFVSEVVTGAGRALRGSLHARHPAGVLSQLDGEFPLEYALLLAGLRTVDRLGGDRSAGLGACRVEIPGDVVTWNGSAIPLTSGLASFAEQDWKVLLELAREGGQA
jgi:CRISPR/Cas system CSM-associated protein Csm3 (group 7 of RAMP superfamily)